MIVDFDPTKDRANAEKHGVPLTFGLRVLQDENHLVLPSLRPVDGEDPTRPSEWWTASSGLPSTFGGATR
jgi:hypothetical protein